MKERIKITPRARRRAVERGVDTDLLRGTLGSGFDGGVTEADLIAWLESAGAGVATGSSVSAVAFDGTASEVAAGNAPVRATPLARAIAAAESVSLVSLYSAAGGAKLTKADVLKAVSEGGAGAAKGAATPAASEGPETAVAAAQGAAVTKDGKRIAGVTPYSGVRKIIGERLAESKFTSPHLYFTQKVDAYELLSLRAVINGKQDKKTSVTDYIARAVVMTLVKYPEMNASLVGDVIEQYENVNLGIAVASPSGLIVPVVKGAERMSVIEISKASSPLFAKAREGKLVPEEYHGGTFTISNLGMFGIENFTAIINPPEVGILAVSATKDEPAVVQGEDGGKSIEIRPLMNITLSVDHRLIDGLLAAQFVSEVKRLLESPIELLI
ncbi:MAG: 2-oxo acid dehydrogenase subunit E2 [Clostridiales Family XIII bacterium]|jgi:pyruvate dehydrogenase E2 component (dihydrolipoamide acetyltransferase)|nr:2-oxo acid dehydrogenase subunit E2 [Clostridiales Family XIII bacterium]